MSSRRSADDWRVVLTSTASITPRRIRWLWDGRIPLNAVTVLAGEPGLGKSTLTVDLAAAVSVGTIDGELCGEPRAVLIASAEDDWASVIVPRLIAAGADLDYVHRIDVAHIDGGAHGLVLPDHVAHLEAAVELLQQQTGQEAALLILDPLGAFLGDARTHEDAAVRSALAPVAELSQRLGIATCCVMHLNKGEADKLLNRITGSGAFGALARAVLVFARVPDDPIGDESPERVLVPCKENWSRRAATLKAEIVTETITVADGLTEISALEWRGESDVRAEDLTGRDRSAVDDAVDFLITELSKGPGKTTQIESDAYARGISKRTLKRARSKLGVQAHRVGGAAEQGWWEMSLPDAAAKAIAATDPLSDQSDVADTESPATTGEAAPSAANGSVPPESDPLSDLEAR